MKRFLLFLLGIMVAAVSMAADVITKKNGTSIQCKVMKVSNTEVEYKNIANLDGPLYALELTEIASITYENGTVDKFGEQSVVTVNAGQRTMTDGDLMRTYEQTIYNAAKAKKMKRVGFILGGIGVAAIAGDIVLTSVTADDGAFWFGCMGSPGITFLAAGTTCYLIGRNKEKQSQQYSFAPIYEKDFQLGNNILSADVDIINDNFTHDKSLGLGLRFTF